MNEIRQAYFEPTEQELLAVRLHDELTQSMVEGKYPSPYEISSKKKKTLEFSLSRNGSPSLLKPLTQITSMKTVSARF